MGMYMYMEIHVFSTLAYENKKGNQPNHDLDKETYIARDTHVHVCGIYIRNLAQHKV